MKIGLTKGLRVLTKGLRVFHIIAATLFFISLPIQIIGFEFNFNYWGKEKTYIMLMGTLVFLITSILMVITLSKELNKIKKEK